MANADGREPRTQGEGLAIAAGCLAFILCFAVGMVTTAIVAKSALSGVARKEIFEALHYDGLMAQWFCGGGIVSLALAVLVASRVARRASPQRPR
jgi:hypothetical protein